MEPLYGSDAASKTIPQSFGPSAFTALGLFIMKKPEGT